MVYINNKNCALSIATTMFYTKIMQYFSVALFLVMLSTRTTANQPYTLITDDLEIKKSSSPLGDIVSHVEDGGSTSAKINVNVTVKKNLPSNLMIQIFTKRLVGSEYASVGVPIHKNFCTFVKDDKMLYPGFLKSGNFPRTCPIKKGFYYLKNYVVDTEKFPPVLPVGKYMLNLLITSSGKTLFDIQWTGQVQSNA